MSKRTKDNYSSQNIKVLKGLEAVRVRPGMYIGNTDDGSGLHHMIYELTDNSVDEALAGFCSEIHIKLHTDGTASVMDNGRGIPVDMHEEEKVSAAQVIMTQLHSGGKFDQDTYKISGGLHGVGVSVVNALSAWLELVIIRDRKCFFMRFKQGEPEAPLQEIELSQYQTLSDIPDKMVSALVKAKSGTYIRFLPDNTIFSDTVFVFNTLKARYRELSFLNPSLKFILEDAQTDKKEVFCDEGGVKNFVLMNAAKQKLLFEEPFNVSAEKSGVHLDIAIVWTASSYDDHTLCFTNNIPQKEGGTHLQGFRTGLTKVVQKFIPENKLKGLTCTGEDIREGMYAVLSAKVPNPRFASQTKEKLVSTQVRSIVEQVMQEALTRWMEENPTNTKLMIERILEAVKAKEAAKKARELVRKNKSPDAGLSVAGKLADCSSKDPAKRELFLVEGASAGGTAKMARNRENQSVLALQGKLLNVEKAMLTKILQYDAIRILIAVLGVGISEECFPEDCKYHKIIIMTDADVDGSHIRTLLLTFFFRYMRPLIEAGYVYVSRPPLYAIKNKKHQPVYLKDDSELEDYIIQHTGNIIKITRNDKAISDEFYMHALQAQKELAHLSELAADFLASKALPDYDKVKLEKYLNEKYDSCVIEEEENLLRVKINKHDREITHTIICKPFSDAVAKLIVNWEPVKVQVHSKVHDIQTLLELIALIANVQANMFDVSRFKGLGEMNPKELRDTGIKPETRVIEQIKFEDLDVADDMVKLLMGDDVPLRRRFIEENALKANVDS